ncbi:hypothetical protein [Sphingobacterium bambusae]|uniref:FAS1 domain-containing protein n=1 Tax=Sphingobacterium bambusae TaxID=662858 RepID=A0ABW6BEG5_9SPHI|nr:hypothetical protein [Sphingobacterium bambusae]WPL47584.1 hypothetical protein SCB77_16640 [Sphingobacterium bambusae]
MKKLILLMVLAVTAYACQKDDYKKDGGQSDPHVNMTTYDFLKSHGSFDSLVRMIDHAGIKDIVNSDVTFFVTTDYGARDYVAAKKQEKIVQVGNENISFSITDIPAQQLRDSMMMYLFDGDLNRDKLSTENTYYTSKLGNIPDVRFNIKLRRTRDFNTYLDYVDYVNFTKVIKTLDEEEADYNAIPDAELDRSFDCQTSGLITTTGIVHVLDNSHRLFFNRGKMAQ